MKRFAMQALLMVCWIAVFFIFIAPRVSGLSQVSLAVAGTLIVIFVSRRVLKPL